MTAAQKSTTTEEPLTIKIDCIDNLRLRASHLNRELQVYNSRARNSPIPGYATGGVWQHRLSHHRDQYLSINYDIVYASRITAYYYAGLSSDFKTSLFLVRKPPYSIWVVLLPRMDEGR